MCIYGTIPDPVAVGVWFRDDYEWRLYDVTSTQLIKAAYVDAEKMLNLTIKSAVHTGGARYTVDLRTMRQTNCASGMQRPVKINMPEAAAVVRACKGVPMANGIQVRAGGRFHILQVLTKGGGLDYKKLHLLFLGCIESIVLGNSGKGFVGAVRA